MRHALSKADKAIAEVHLGLTPGWTGVSLAAARVGYLLGCEELLERALSLALRLSGQIAAETDLNIMAGSSRSHGRLPHLERDHPGEASLLDYGSRLADELIGSQK